MTANVRTITGYTAGGTLHWEMSEIFQGGYCSAGSGNTCTPIQYLSGAPLVGEFSGLSVLTVALWFPPSPTTVLGFSQGSLIATEWLRGNDGKWGTPSPEDLSFVLVANPLRKHGGVRPAYDIDEPTPDTSYDILDIAIEYDGVADFPDNPFNLLAFANALAGFQYVHIDGYEDVDLKNAEKLVWVEGNTTYVLIRNENIPLLEPLRELGLGALADTLNDPLKAMIDSGYDRDYSGLVGQDQHDTVLQQYSSLRADLPEVGPAAAASSDVAHPSSVVGEPTPESDAEQQVADSSPTLASGEPTAENPRAATEADDQQKRETETETAIDADADAQQKVDSETESETEAATAEAATADADENLEIESDDIESDLERQDDDTAPEDERSSNGIHDGSESESDSDETESQRGGEADGPDSESDAPSGGSDSTSGSSAE